MNKNLLGFSVVLNVALLSTVGALLINGDQVSMDPARDVRDLADTKEARPVEDEADDGEARGSSEVVDVRGLHAQLTKANVPADAAKRVIASTISSIAYVDPNLEYWRPRLYRDVARRVSEIDALESGRRTIVEIYGQTAEQDPAFASIFWPKQSRWAFLSAESQVAVERILSANLRSRFKNGGRAPTPAEVESLDQELRAAITPSEFREFQLRESSLAGQLTSIEFEFTEQEYRKVFDVWSNAIASSPPERRQALSPLRAGPSDDGVMKQVESALGQERYALYARGQDPVFKLLTSTAALYSLSPRSAERAYTVIQDAKMQAMPLIAKSPILSVDTREKLLALRSDRSKKLRDIFGESTAQLVERSMAPFDAFDIAIGRVPVVMSR